MGNLCTKKMRNVNSHFTKKLLITLGIWRTLRNQSASMLEDIVHPPHHCRRHHPPRASFHSVRECSANCWRKRVTTSLTSCGPHKLQLASCPSSMSIHWCVNGMAVMEITNCSLLGSEASSTGRKACLGSVNLFSMARKVIRPKGKLSTLALLK